MLLQKAVTAAKDYAAKELIGCLFYPPSLKLGWIQSVPEKPQNRISM
jgi:hypothetical protein